MSTYILTDSEHDFTPPRHQQSPVCRGIHDRPEDPPPRILYTGTHADLLIRCISFSCSALHFRLEAFSAFALALSAGVAFDFALGGIACPPPDET
eukprot:3840223-Pyramimonas_sp.AAC.1